MAAHNYDGDMLTDEVAQVHRSPGFITSNLIGKNDDGTLIKGMRKKTLFYNFLFVYCAGYLKVLSKTFVQLSCPGSPILRKTSCCYNQKCMHYFLSTNFFRVRGFARHCGGPVGDAPGGQGDLYEPPGHGGGAAGGHEPQVCACVFVCLFCVCCMQGYCCAGLSLILQYRSVFDRPKYCFDELRLNIFYYPTLCVNLLTPTRLD